MSNTSDFIIENGVLKKYVGSGGDVVIPEGVTSIGQGAFRNCFNVTGITIPQSVTSIRKWAFWGCSGITKIVIPEGIQEIGQNLFKECEKLKEVILPDGVVGISDFAFEGCSNLTKFTFPKSIRWISKGIFLNCSRLTDITIPEGITDIPDRAFYGCSSLECITIPEGIQWIREEAFCTGSNIQATIFGTPYLYKDCFATPFFAPKMPLNIIKAPALKKLAVLGWILRTERDPDVDATVASSFQKHWETHFDNYLDSFNRDERLLLTVVEKHLLTLDQTDKLLELFGKNVEAVALLLEYKHQHFTDQVIEAHEEKMLENQMKGTSAAEIKRDWVSEVLPDGTIQLNAYLGKDSEIFVPERIGKKPVTRIGYDCFSPYRIDKTTTNNVKLNQITSVTIPEGVKSIGVDAFRGCSSLTSVTIPESIRIIGRRAFYDCSSLTSVTIPESVRGISPSAFEGTALFKDENQWENGVLYIGKHLIRAKESLSGVYAVKEGTRCIAACAFDNCSSLKRITIPVGVVDIGWCAFENCSSLTSMTIPEGVKSIGETAFQGCSGLASVTIPESVTSIGPSAFEGTALFKDESQWENCVLYIGKHLIRAKESLSGVYTVKGGTSCICVSAFENCKSLTSITIPEGVTSIGANAFEKCSSLTSITIPESVTSIGASAFEKCSSLTSIIIPESVTNIGRLTFSECRSLKSVTIPKGMTSIGERAFWGSGLTSITIPDGVREIGCEMFRRSDLKWIALPTSVTYIDNSAFRGCPYSLVIHAPAGAYAEKFAKKKKISFEAE